MGDINNDGWMDIYISNDFFERDYLYENQRDGTFKEILKNAMNSISTTSMSGDIADLNNDGFPEIFIADMLPESEKRIKTLTDFIGWKKYQAEINMGYHRKFERNMLHYNNGNDTFSEIGRYAGVDATDWSWGGLIADFNLDGAKDIYVPNGVYKDITNKDFLINVSQKKVMRSFIKNGKLDYKKLVKATPSHPIPNYMFENIGNLSFENQASEWGLDEPSFSNGAAYGDLDRDGDLDLVVNNINNKPFIYRNNTTDLYPERSWIQLVLKGNHPNTFGVGAKVELVAEDHHWYAEQILQRGFQSSIDPTLDIGLKETISLIDTIKVHWPNGQASLRTNVHPRKRMVIKQPETGGHKNILASSSINKRPLLHDVTQKLGINWKHQESSYDDFESNPMLFHMRSTEGPPLCSGDINNDDRDDFYIGGAARQAGALFLQTNDGKFVETNQSILKKDRTAEDTDCIFFDADGDSKPELYVASGSSEFSAANHTYADRLYKFSIKKQLVPLQKALPIPKSGYYPTGVVRAADIDSDDDLDLFIGVRINPSAYGIPVGGHLLINDGKGKFTDQTDRLAPQLRSKTMKSAGITNAAWGDINGDSTLDLVLAGEWMPLTVYLNQSGHLEQADPKAIGLDRSGGLWLSLALVDLDADGDLDIVGGNQGLNSQFKANFKQPLQLWVGDLDQNGTIEQIFADFKKAKGPYPIALRQNLLMQLPYLKSIIPTFSDYAEKTVYDIFTSQQLNQAIHYRAQQLASVVAWNNGNGNFQIQPLPFQAQLAPVYSILAADLDGDNIPELLMGGNLSAVKPQEGSYEASYGNVLKLDSLQNYYEISKSGFFNRGDIRAIRSIKTSGKDYIFVARNNKKLRIFEIHNN